MMMGLMILYHKHHVVMTIKKGETNVAQCCFINV